MIIKFIKKKFNLIKICAVFTTVCFVVSTLGANLYAIPLAENANQKYEDVFNKASSISAEYGKITASKDANSDITIINIQDLHCHPQTQRNISKIIAQIAEKYNLKEIYVEGGYGNIDLNWLTSIKDENIRKQVTEKLLEEGLLTGSEYYKLTSGNKDVELKGIDEENLHRENVKRLAWIIENQGKYKDVIKKVENEINILEKMYVNSRNERFNRDIEKYLTNKIDSRRFYRQLAKYVKDINANPDKYNNITAIRLEDYPNIVKFITLRKISKDIDVRKVTQQLQAVINELKNRLPYNIYTQLLKETENLSDSQKVVELVTSLCKKEGIDLQYKYKALNDFLQSNEINRELNTVKLVYEERQLITEIRKALSYNNEEYEITFVSDFSRFFKDYLEYKLTDADWKYFESGYEQFRQLYAKYATVDRIKEVEKDFAELNKYYGINDIRNEVFVNNLLQDKHPDVIEQSKFREDEKILKGSKEVIIAVTGGFHSNALEDILQAKEVNTIVITPSIFEGIEKATKQYKGIIKEQSKEFQHQALAYRILSSLKDQEQKIYLYGALKSLLGDNINKLKEVLGEDVDLDSLEKELQNLQLSSDEQSQLKVSRTTQFLESVADAIINEPLFPKEGGKAVFVPNVNKIILKVSETLVDAGIFLSNGPIFAAEQRGLPYLKEIAPEIYSRMPAFIQEALVATEVFAIEESAVEEDTDEDILEKSETVIEIEKADSSYFSEEEKAELLEKVRDEKKPFSVDQDLVFSVFEKMIIPFVEDNNVDNIDEYYELFLRKLFSLQPEILQFLNDKMDGQSVKDLLVDYEAEVIDENLTYLLARYNKKLSSLKNFSRIVSLFENIEKLNYLSEQDFDYFMDLPNQFFIYVLEKTENSSQLKTKITVGKNFYPKNRFKNIDKDLAKAYFANAEKLESLDESYYERFIGLNKEAQIFILNNVKSSSDIERIFEFSGKNKISSDFDEKVKDFTDVRFKALVKYISSVDDISFYDELFSTDYYGQKNIFGDYDKRTQKVLKIIVDSIDDANFIKEYLLNSEYKKKYSSFFRRLAKLKIENVAVENDYLALKLLIDENFNKALDDSEIHIGVPTSSILLARYHAAIAVSRFIYDGAEGEIKDYDISENKELIKEITDLYVLLLRAADGNVLMDSKTKIYVLCNDEKNNDGLTDRFNTASIERMAKLAGVEVPIITFLRKDNLDAKDGWLKQIEDLVLASDGKAYFFFNGHGQKNSLCVKNDEEYISAEELADRLFKLATKPNNPVDLRRVTIDLSCCHSYFFARDVYKLLEEKFKGNPDKESYPTIITAAGLETEVGYTTRIGAGAVTLSNLHDGILTVLNKRTETAPITLGMLALSEYQFSLSNITMFTSFSDETLLERIAETKKHISAAFKDSKGKAIEVESKTSDPRVKLKTKVPNLPIFGFEASIFKEDNYAPLWEELFYRFAPALMLTILISVTMMFAPAGFVLFTKIGFAVILTLFQTIFVKAHIVTDWLRAKDSGGEKSSEEVPETSISDKQSKTVDLGKVFEKDLTFEDKINKIFKTVKERLFAVFSDSKDAESFKIFYKTNKIAAEHKDGLIIPTIAFTIPYVVVMCFFPSIQAVMIATIVSMALHAINNIVAKIIKEKGLLQKKKRDIDFQDIQRRIKHIKLLIENPNVERDLPELKEGSFVLKFGLARKAERRAESLLEYEKIRIFFINRLKDEMAKREEIKAELETIKKARKTKKNKAKIQELEEQLEIMEKEYPRIYNELLFADTKEVEKTIDKIDALLSIFEEIDIILDNIENFKLENADDEDAYKEISALEEDFLDFAENTFMNSLMSLYNNQKTTGIHVRRVVGDSNLIGTKMLSGNNVRMMYKLMLSSILHDIGKNLVPLQILDKQGSFDRLERNIMEFHVVFGGIILRSSILRRLSYTAENHHRYTLKTKMDDLGKETEVGDLHIPTISSLDEEKEEQIERIVKFLEEINPDLSFDSASQYPKSLEDIKSILEDNDMDLTESQQEKLDDLLREVEQIEEEVLIAKIVSLADVFEAVSPKLSFDSERTYQFPQKIRDISSMLENIDIDLTESQKREVIVLLAEIAQIDSEDDAAKKQEMEQKFIKKVLYDRSKSVVIKYIREQNYKNVRENAFKVIFTKSPKDIFKELGKTEEEFMADFENDPKGTIDECMSLVDADKFEFDSDVIRAFLEFYFSSEDIRVNNAIIDNLNKKKENRFIVHIKDVLYSLYKLQRSVNRMLVRFTPVIASVFHGLGEQEKDISVKDLFDIDTEIINHDVLIRKSDGEIYILHFDEKSFEQKGRRFAGVTMLPKNYGIKEIEYDENGRISNVILEGGTRIEPLFTKEEKEKIEREQGKLVGNKENNLPFEDFILDSIKENIREITGNNVAETVDIYLDSETVISDMETAIKENKLMIIHVFEEGFKTEDLSLRQLYEKYNQILSLINGGFAQIFSGNTEAEEQILKQIEEDLTAEEKEDSEWMKRETAKALFSLREILKNDFDHGNNGLIEYPIALYISKNKEGKVSDIITYNAGAKSTDIDSIDKKTLSNLIYESYISGSKKGAKYMESSLFINFEDGFISTDGAEGKYKIHRTRVTLKSKQEQEDALAKYNQYIQENRQKELEKQQRLAKMSEEEKEAALRRDAESTHAAKMAEFWEDFFSILKPFGVKLGNYAHVWEEVVFRYLPTVFILLGYMNPLVGLGIQVVFILAHPLAKWMAARMNWEKAKKEGKQVGEKAGIGDLFKQIGKDFLLLTPTLVMMLPYVGALLSLAINPALSLIITPAIFTFTDVIVKWLTKKDSGGEVISIDKNLVIFITIVSLGSYIFLPLIPVIHPIVNTLINPIVITNAINAGYLHYEYNKRQENRSKLLSIIPTREDEHIKIIADSISLDGNYEVSKHFFRFRPGDLIKFKDSSSIMKEEGNSITISLPNNWKFSKHAANNGLNIQDGKVSIKKENQLQRFVVIIDENKKEHIFVINQSGYKEVTISLDKDNGVPLEKLKKTTGVDIDEKGGVLPEDKDKIVLKIHDLKFESCFEPFTIEFNGKKNNFIFRNKKLYKISEYGRLEEVNLDESTLLSYGIESFKSDGNKITSFIISKEREFGAAVRQAVGIDEEEMEYRMEQILASGETGVELFLLDDFKEIPSAFVTYFFQVQGLENSLIEKILETHGNTISPENLEKSLTNNGFLEEDAKMWVERIFAEYISNFSNIDISEEIPLDFLRYFLEQEESKDILKRQDIIELLSRRGKTISKEDLKNELKKLGFSEEDAQNMADEVELDVYGEKIPTRFLDFYFKDYPLKGVKDIGRTLVLRNPDLTSIAFLRRFLKKKGFSEEDIKNLIEEIKKAFKGEKEGEKGKLATVIVQSLLLKDDLIEKLGYKFTKKQAQQIANKCRKKDGNLVSFETLQEVFNEFFGEKATENLPKIMEYLYSKDEELNSKLYDSDKADNAEGIRISFLRTFFEEEGLSEKDVIVFFFERAKSISIENLERELLGLGYSEQKAKNLIERIRSKYPQKIDKFKFEKIPTDYITSLFNKGFVDRKIILLLESGKAMSKEDLEEEFGKYWSKDRAKDLVEKIFAEYIKDIRRENIHVLSRYQTERILLRAGVKSENIQINEDGTFPDTIKKDLEEANLQDKELEIDDTVTREKLISLLNYTPVLVSMSIQALSRAFALDKQSTENRDDSITTLGGLIGYLKKKKNDKNDTYLRGYFAEIYLSNKTVAGTINGLKIRLQLPDNTSEPGIDLVDPIKGMKVQVKIDIGRSTQKASSKNPDIPIACTMEVAGNKDKSLIKGFVKMKTIDAFAEEFLSLITDEKLSLTGEESDIKLSDITGHEIFAIDELLGIFNRAAILPENIGLVNRIMQSKFGNAFIAATVIAFKEFRASLEPNFVDLHQTAAGKRGAQEVASLANRYNITENDTLVTKIVKSVLGIIFKGASIVKHIAIDYRYIKASGIQEAISMFGKDARLTEDGQIEVAIVEDIEQLQNSFTLVNTGLKVDGASIYRIKNTDLLMFGAKGQQSIKIVQTINGTEQLKKSVMEILKSSGQQIDDIETQGIVTKQGEGIEVKEGIIEIGEMELKGKTSQQIKEFITSSLEINRATGIMYGQKTIIGLEYIGASDINKLKSAIENGRARKVITKEQYIALRAYMNENKENSFNEYLLELRKNGIEIYIDAREQVIEQKEIEDGIAGQIVTENGELYIQDYYSLEQTKLLKVDSEMLKERSLEQIILSESETIFVGIEILLEQFRQSNINVVQREFGALLGKIKLSLNIGELNFKDIENILYNIDYNKIPKLELAPSKNLQEYTKEDINAMIDSLILNMEETSEISIILKAIRKNKNFNEQDYDAFVQVIKERILAKTALIKGYKEYGLKDKRLEKLLGQLLFKQLDFNLEDKDPKEEKNFDFTYIDKDEQIRVVNGDKEKSEDNKEAEYVFMRKIVQDTEKARRGDKVAINSIIDIILTYGDEYKEKQLARDMDKNDIRNYRAMMSAA